MHPLIKKLLTLFIAFFITVSLSFFLMKMIPGDPFTNKKAIPKEIVVAMYKHYGFDDPIYIQYGRFLNNLLHGDLGPSFKYKGRSVSSMIASGFSKSALLGLQALLFSLFAGLTIASISALKRQSFIAKSLQCVGIFFLCIPSFLLATLLQYLFAIKLGWLPIARMDQLGSTLLPTLAISALPTAFISRIGYDRLVHLLDSDMIKLARAKGLSKIRILRVHLLPAALTPIIAYLGFDLATILSGSFIVERIFAIPGIGYAMVSSVMNRDYTVIMGMTIFYCALFLSFIFLSDLLIYWLNPQLRRGEQC